MTSIPSSLSSYSTREEKFLYAVNEAKAALRNSGSCPQVRVSQWVPKKRWSEFCALVIANTPGCKVNLRNNNLEMGWFE